MPPANPSNEGEEMIPTLIALTTAACIYLGCCLGDVYYGRAVGWGTHLVNVGVSLVTSAVFWPGYVWWVELSQDVAPPAPLLMPRDER